MDLDGKRWLVTMSEKERGLLCPGGGLASTEFRFSYY